MIMGCTKSNCKEKSKREPPKSVILFYEPQKTANFAVPLMMCFAKEPGTQI